MYLFSLSLRYIYIYILHYITLQRNGILKWTMYFGCKLAAVPFARSFLISSAYVFILQCCHIGDSLEYCSQDCTVCPYSKKCNTCTFAFGYVSVCLRVWMLVCSNTWVQICVAERRTLSFGGHEITPCAYSRHVQNLLHIFHSKWLALKLLYILDTFSSYIYIFISTFHIKSVGIYSDLLIKRNKVGISIGRALLKMKMESSIYFVWDGFVQKFPYLKLVKN